MEANADDDMYCKTCYHNKPKHIGGLECIGVDGHGNCGCKEWVFGELRVTSATGGQKGTKEERFDLVPVYPLTLMARLYGFGAKKYAAHNWRKGYDWSKSYASAMRHMTQFWNGEDIDPETQIPHVICAAFHMFVLAQYMEDHPELDDRFKKDDIQQKIQELRKKITEDAFEKLVAEPVITVVDPPIALDIDDSGEKDREHELNRAAAYVATLPRGKTITFSSPQFSMAEMNEIMERARKIRESRSDAEKPAKSTPPIKAVPTTPSYNPTKKLLTIPYSTGVQYFDDSDRLLRPGGHTLTESMEVHATAMDGYYLEMDLDYNWFFAY